MCGQSLVQVLGPRYDLLHLLGKIQGGMKERNHQPWDDQDGMQIYDDNWLLNPLPLSFSCLKQSQLLRGIAEEVELKEH